MIFDESRSEFDLNIFYLDHDPRIAAQSHCDRHVVKMILESAQMLSTAWHVLAPDALDSTIGSTDPQFPDSDFFALQKSIRLPLGLTHYIGNQRIYGRTHEHHPCAEWVRETSDNYDWLWRLGQHLCDEYHYRYGRLHATRHVLRTLELPPPGTPRSEQTEPPPAMPEEYVVEEDGFVSAVASYQTYYRGAKQHLLTYTKRDPPAWCADLAKLRSKLRTGQA